MWINPITDRTEQDVEYAREHRGEPDYYKGAQNYIDWNRLTGNMYHIAGTLNAHGHQIILTCKNDWSIGDIPAVEDIYHMKTDLQLLRYGLYGFYNYAVLEWHELDFTIEQVDARERAADEYYSKQPIPDLPYTHYEKINELEQIVTTLLDTLEQAAPMHRVSGTFGAGQLSYLPRLIDTMVDYMTVQEFNGLLRTVLQLNSEQRTAANYYRKY